jgi:hypothetical protein
MMRVLALLVVDATLIGMGVALILSYLDAREHASNAARPTASAAAAPAESLRVHDDAAADERIRQQVSEAVDRLRPDIQRCYAEASQAAGPGALPEGRLDVGLTIAADGRLTRAAAVVDDLGSQSLTRCVEALFQDLRFSERPGGESVETVWPLRFKAPK